jgi:hypothetical protein
MTVENERQLRVEDHQVRATQLMMWEAEPESSSQLKINNKAKILGRLFDLLIIVCLKTCQSLITCLCTTVRKPGLVQMLLRRIRKVSSENINVSSARPFERRHPPTRSASQDGMEQVETIQACDNATCSHFNETVDQEQVSTAQSCWKFSYSQFNAASHSVKTAPDVPL